MADAEPSITLSEVMLGGQHIPLWRILLDQKTLKNSIILLK